jgi:hypothetical protein
VRKQFTQFLSYDWKYFEQVDDLFSDELWDHMWTSLTKNQTIIIAELKEEIECAL